MLFGIGLGGDYMIIPLMAADMYGLAVMGRVMGVVLTADSVAEAGWCRCWWRRSAIGRAVTKADFWCW